MGRGNLGVVRPILKHWESVLPCFLFFLSLLRAEIKPISGPQHQDRVTVQCDSPGRGEELVGVRGCVR